MLCVWYTQFLKSECDPWVALRTSQLHAKASQGRICKDNCSYCHTEKEVAHQISCPTQPPYTYAGPTSPGAWQGSFRASLFFATGGKLVLFTWYTGDKIIIVHEENLERPVTHNAPHPEPERGWTVLDELRRDTAGTV